MVGLLLGTCIAASAGAQTMDSLAVARRIVAAASLAAKEYAVGVAPGVAGARRGRLPGAVHAVSRPDRARGRAESEAAAGSPARKPRGPGCDEHGFAAGCVSQDHARRGGHGHAAVRGDALPGGPL